MEGIPVRLAVCDLVTAHKQSAVFLKTSKFYGLHCSLQQLGFSATSIQKKQLLLGLFWTVPCSLSAFRKVLLKFCIWLPFSEVG